MCAVNRLTGLVTGMNTDTIVKNMMKAESVKLDRLNQQKQRKLWEQDQFRDVITKIRDFQSSFLDIVKPDTNMRSERFFSKFSSSITSQGATSTAVSVSGTGNLTTPKTIDSIDQLASKDIYKSEAAGVSVIKSGEIDPNFATGGELKFTLSVGNTSRSITLSAAETSTITDSAGLASALNNKIKAAFGNNSAYANLVKTDGTSITFSKPGSEVRIFSSTGFETSLDRLGVTNGASTNDYMQKTIGTKLGLTTEDLGKMTINGKSLASMGITIASTIGDMVSKVNKDKDSNVSFTYNSIEDKFMITSLKEGSENSISISDGNTGIWKDKLKFTANSENEYSATTEAKDAILTVNGMVIQKPSNKFELDGLTVNLNALSSNPIEINMKNDTTAITDKVKGFVTSYNKLIEDLGGKVNEKFYRDFAPLTKDQKDGMKEDEIKKWEEKSMSGLLRNNSDINNMLSNLRKAIYDTVEGAGLSLKDIGISSTSNYKENGKLELNEEKFKAALENNYDNVVKLFTSTSDKAYGDSANRMERYRESGIGERINDILQDNIRITRDSSNRKGILIEKAGIKNDISAVKNTISGQIDKYDESILKMTKYLANKEEKYYEMYSKMETAMKKMEAQSQSLASFLGGSN